MASKKSAADLSIVDNITTAYACGVYRRGWLALPYPKHPIALIWALVGALAPVMSHVIAAHLHPLTSVDMLTVGKTYANPMLYLWTFALVGFLTFSAKTVYEWLNKGFKSEWKALGITVGVETVMVFSYSEIPSISYVALGMLVAINMTAVACDAVLDTGKKRTSSSGSKSRAKGVRGTKKVSITGVASNSNGTSKAA